MTFSTINGQIMNVITVPPQRHLVYLLNLTETLPLNNMYYFIWHQLAVVLMLKSILTL